MLSLLIDALRWLDCAEQASKAADLLTDPEAKAVMLQFGKYCGRQARAILACTTGRQRDIV